MCYLSQTRDTPAPAAAAALLPPPWIRLRFLQIKLAQPLAPSTVPAALSLALGELTSSNLFFSIAVCFIQDSRLFSRLLLPLGETQHFRVLSGSRMVWLGQKVRAVLATSQFHPSSPESQPCLPCSKPKGRPLDHRLNSHLFKSSSFAS